MVARETKRCARCKKPRDRKTGYCSECHAKYMRDWRPKHYLPSARKRKEQAR